MLMKKEHIVQKGDTLWGIAKQYLGEGKKWKEIHQYNYDTIKNPDLIFPGQVVKIPGSFSMLLMKLLKNDSK